MTPVPTTETTSSMKMIKEHISGMTLKQRTDPGYLLAEVSTVIMVAQYNNYGAEEKEFVVQGTPRQFCPCSGFCFVKNKLSNIN